MTEDLGPYARKPIILPKDHHLTRLIINECHERVRSESQIVKKLLSSCVVCRRVAGKAFGDPQPAHLPEVRVKGSPPFSKTCLDMACVKHKTSSSKVYVALFTVVRSLEPFTSS